MMASALKRGQDQDLNEEESMSDVSKVEESRTELVCGKWRQSQDQNALDCHHKMYKEIGKLPPFSTVRRFLKERKTD